MSWDCPHWLNEICQLNGITCKPGKGKCILKDKVEFKISSDTEKKQPTNRKTDEPK